MITHYDMVSGEMIASEDPDEVTRRQPGVATPVPRLMTVQEASALHPVAPRGYGAVVMQPMTAFLYAMPD